MYQLNYRSVAKPGLTLEELNKILETATTVNRDKNITGCLIYHNNSFVQILEGEEKDVKEIYEGIKKDDRHLNVTLMWENQVSKRFFEDWSMAYYNPQDKGIQQFVNNMLLLTEFSNKSSGSLFSFWETVRRVISSGDVNELEEA